jgi:uncharacterized membrane protein YhaH (DUF805 family)
MRGEVLHYDETQGFGFITGADGNRYTFRREDMRQAFPVSKGTPIVFKESGSQAREIFLIRDEAPVAARTTAPFAATAAAPAVPRPQNFGRFAVESPASTGLWSYFRSGVTSNYANFRGRARRKEYWGFVLFYMVAILLLSIAGVAIDAGAGNFDYAPEAPFVTIALIGLFLLATLIPGMAICVRRLHDFGLSGWFYLVFLAVSLVTSGGLIMLVIGLIPSQKRENRWGPVPEGIVVPAAQIPAAVG